MNLLSKLAQKISTVLPSYTIRLTNPLTGILQDYLTRYYGFLADREFGNIFIHEFHSSDLDVGEGGFGLLHNHPWKSSFSIVLTGGYWEERLNKDGKVYRKFIKPGSINFINSNVYHRVDLENKPVWTLFFTSGRNKKSDWYFYDRITKKYKHWKESPNAIK